jgi:hypothetical protein
LIVPSISTVVFFVHVAADAVGAVASTVKESVEARASALNFVNFFMKCFLSRVD